MNIQKDKRINKSSTGKLNTTDEFSLAFKNLPQFAVRMRYCYVVTCCLYTVSIYSTIVINKPQPRGVHIIILSTGKRKTCAYD